MRVIPSTGMTGLFAFPGTPAMSFLCPAAFVLPLQEAVKSVTS